MEDFQGLLVLLLIYLFSGVFSSKKNKGKRKRTGTSGRTAGRNLRSEGKMAESGFPSWMDAKPSQQSAAGQQTMQHPAAAVEKDCQTRPIHLHEVSQEAYSFAEEGEDPCHAGGLNVDTDAVYTQESTIGSLSANDLLRGMIMSEILTRPAQRTMLRRSRRIGQ